MIVVVLKLDNKMSAAELKELIEELRKNPHVGDVRGVYVHENGGGLREQQMKQMQNRGDVHAKGKAIGTE